MKQTDFIRQINREDRKYKIIKMKYYLQMKLSFGKKREQREFAYSIFTRDKELNTIEEEDLDYSK